MSNPGELPELEPLPDLEPLEETAAAPPTATPQQGSAMAVSMAGMPAPLFSMRAQREYYRFMFAGVLMLLGCMMPFGPEWDMAGYKTLGGAVFTVIALGILWTSWIAISHGRFDLSAMRWLILATIPLTIQIWHLVGAFDEPAVVEYIRLTKAANPANLDLPIDSWGKLGNYLAHVKTPHYSQQLDNFVRAYGPGKLVLLLGSLLAVKNFLMGVLSGMKAGKAQKAAQEAARAATKKPGSRR